MNTAYAGTVKRGACDSDNKPVTRSMSEGRPPRLVLRFALYSALALALAGTGILLVVRHEAQVRADRELTSDATRAAATLSTQLRKADLTEPVTSPERLAALDALFAPELMNGVVRVKLWRRDGTVTYSNDHSLIGTRVDAEELDEVLAGRTVRETGRLNDEGGQGKNIKVTSAYVPLRLADEQRPRGVRGPARGRVPLSGTRRAAPARHLRERDRQAGVQRVRQPPDRRLAGLLARRMARDAQPLLARRPSGRPRTSPHRASHGLRHRPALLHPVPTSGARRARCLGRGPGDRDRGCDRGTRPGAGIPARHHAPQGCRGGAERQ